MICNVITRDPMPAMVATLLLALAASISAPALAETADKQQPISVSAEEPLEGNLTAKDFTLSKNVIVSQGTTLIHADRLQGKQNVDSSMSATAYGNPVSFRTKSDGVDEFKEAYAKKIVYDGQSGVIELFGDALLKEGKNELRGEYIRYDTHSGKFLGGQPDTAGVTSGPGPRVRGVFMPREDDGAPGKDGAKDKGAKAPAKDTKAAAKDAKPAAAAAPATAATSATPASDADKAASKGAQPPPVPLQSDTELKTTQ
jgi:lipopolysaccharide export system protein LptA